MFVLYFEDEDGKNYSVCLKLDWLEDYVGKSELGAIGDFLESYNSKEVEKIIDALDCDNQPYTIQEEHQFSGFAE